MSNWTHVAGIIRIDGLVYFGEPDFDEIIGKECLWESPEAVWKDAKDHPEKYLPMGSEGSLQKSVWVNPDKSCLASYTVSVFGDLRDHNNADAIVEWFKGKCKSMWVRNAVITVENELYGTKTYTYVYEEEEEES